MCKNVSFLGFPMLCTYFILITYFITLLRKSFYALASKAENTAFGNTDQFLKDSREVSAEKNFLFPVQCNSYLQS